MRMHLDTMLKSDVPSADNHSMKFHVFSLGNVPGIFGVLSYFPETMVSVAVFADEPSIEVAIQTLAAKYSSETFVHADANAEAWGRAVYKSVGSAVVDFVSV